MRASAVGAGDGGGGGGGGADGRELELLQRARVGLLLLQRQDLQVLLRRVLLREVAADHLPRTRQRRRQRIALGRVAFHIRAHCSSLLHIVSANGCQPAGMRGRSVRCARLPC
eukprot:236795-Rhodomonas_salina.1